MRLSWNEIRTRADDGGVQAEAAHTKKSDGRKK
jgi:hypothetical protein